MKHIVLTFFFITVCIGLFAQTVTQLTTFQGLQRRFIVHLPNGYAAGQHLPMVINMHGYGSNDGQQELYTKMDGVADANHFIVIYPNGIDSAWNVGWVGALDAGINDVGFISHVIDTMIQLYGIDTNRVYACGMSNGGFMSHKLACDLGNRIAAVASVAGTFSDSMVLTCNPARKIPVMQIHGTADGTVPYNGFGGGIGVEATISKWLGYNQCSSTNDTIAITNSGANDHSTVQRIDYRTCGDNTQVLFFKVIDGGHTWPGALIDLPGVNTNHDIDASTEIWNFFKQYSLQGMVGIDDVPSQQAALTVYPNPTDGHFTLSIHQPTKTIKIELIGIDGRVHYSEQLQNQMPFEKKYDFNHLAKGIYLLKVNTNNEVQVTRVMVQ